MNRLNLRPFTPSREDPAALVGRTVGRDLLLDSIERRLLTAATTKNRCHTLIVGPRGSGKTHVLDVALHRLRNDPRQNEGLVVARLDEDVVGIVTYADLVVHISEALGLPVDAARRTRASRDVVAMEAAITAHLQGRALVVVVENLSRVFESFGTTGQQDFRSFVETSGEVMLLASAPLLFQGVTSRRQPWFGSFAIEHLTELTLDEGTELLRRLAVEDGDEPFARYILEPRGQGRLAALHHLAGGSPRLWMVLAGCASVELLDDLVPAVEELLEKLVAYYQQRLWELPGNEQKLVRELGTGPPSATVADLAAHCGLEERTAASALGRLAEAGWVRSEKLPGTDRRKSWYRLREPLLRHHFQYRQADGETLRLIVDILRLWFDPSERRIHLAAVRPTSVAERHLMATLPLDPPQRFDGAYEKRDVDAYWHKQAGHMAQAIPAMRRVAEDRVLTLGPDHPETHMSRHHLACWSGEAGRVDEAINGLSSLVNDKIRVLGCDDPSTIISRNQLARWLGVAGRVEEAIAGLSGVVEDERRILGDDHPNTLVARYGLAYWLGEADRVEEAIAQMARVVDAMIRVLGPADQQTQIGQRSLLQLLVQGGRHDEAVRLAIATLDGAVMSLGDQDPATREAADRLVKVLVDLLRSGLPLPQGGPAVGTAARQIMALLLDMEAARDGSAEAGARLPAALRALVDEMQCDPQRVFLE